MNLNNHQDQKLSGRIILISGAGGGLGSTAAKACAAAGACVVLLDQATKRLERLHDEIVGSGHPQPAIYPMDLTTATQDDYTELAEIIDRQFGLLHGLLHSAADLGVPGPLADVTESEWNRVLRVNLSAPHGLTRALLPLMQRTGDASVLFTSDSSARLGRGYWGSYGVSKIAMEGMARMWAEELASAGRVRVNVLSPGPVKSPLRRRSHPGELAEEIPPPETLAARYVYLLGPESRGVTCRVFEGSGHPWP